MTEQKIQTADISDSPPTDSQPWSSKGKHIIMCNRVMLHGTDPVKGICICVTGYTCVTGHTWN